MLLHQRNKIRRRVTGQRRLREVWIRGDEVFRTAMNVGEITAAATGNENFLSRAFRSLEHGHTPSTLTRLQGAHQPRRAAAQDQRIKDQRIKDQRIKLLSCRIDGHCFENQTEESLIDVRLNDSIKGIKMLNRMPQSFARAHP